jgi:hypothetical protein
MLTQKRKYTRFVLGKHAYKHTEVAFGKAALYNIPHLHTIRSPCALCYALCKLFLGAYVKLLKAAISFVTSVRLSVRMENLGSHWKDFHDNIWVFFENLSKISGLAHLTITTGKLLHITTYVLAG